jgi:hypothetical protein
MELQAMIVAIYARFSTSDQSCDMKLHELRPYVAKRGWEVFAEYVDTGFSGAAASRINSSGRRGSASSIRYWCGNSIVRIGVPLRNYISTLVTHGTEPLPATEAALPEGPPSAIARLDTPPKKDMRTGVPGLERHPVVKDTSSRIMIHTTPIGLEACSKLHHLPGERFPPRLGEEILQEDHLYVPLLIRWGVQLRENRKPLIIGREIVVRGFADVLQVLIGPGEVCQGRKIRSLLLTSFRQLRAFF